MEKLKTAYFFSIIAVALTFPYFAHLNSVLIFICCLLSAVSNPINEKWANLKSNPWIIFFIIYYLVQVVGYFNSSNEQEALFILEKKGGMALLPIFLASGTQLSKSQIKTILLSVVASVLLGGLAMILLSGFDYFENKDSAVFYYHQLSNQLGAHAIYFSVVVATSIFLLMKFKSLVFNAHTILYYVLLSFLAILLILLSSKMILIISLFLFLALQLIQFKKREKKAMLVLITVIGVVFMLFGGGISSRFSEIINQDLEVLGQEKYKYDTPLNGLTLRITFWNIVIETLSQESNSMAFGVGTGDAQETLRKAYQNKGLYIGNPELKDRGYLDYNVHSQYFEELLKNGVLGLIALLILISTILGISKKDRFSFSILLIISCFFLTESGLERHAGSILFTLISVLLILDSNQQKRLVG
ncbi:MAG: hypothetical protein CL840_16940 [Crocinitomicaceae bacterium]|nr:hypothetical protein [Crocinitomicaceae bacterium]|tara:strand:+ start:2050 stop:3297 length:1248 start_codon:yes stop_codon:yes gene_type:complete